MPEVLSPILDRAGIGGPPSDLKYWKTLGEKARPFDTVVWITASALLYALAENWS